MKTIVINDNQKGLLFNNGKYIKTLDAGKYRLFGGYEAEILPLTGAITSNLCTPDTLLRDPDFASQVSVVEVGDEEFVLHFINDRFASTISTQGKFAFWNAGNTHKFQKVNISSPWVSEDFPTYLFSKIPSKLFTKIEVCEYMKARLYLDNHFTRILDAGVYYFWNCSTKVSVEFVDTRLTQMDITGQEILTQDKISLRINFTCTYRITDYVKISTEIDDYQEQMHVAAQLALRDYIGKYKLDEILENKDALSKYVCEQLKAKEGELFVEIKDAGVKDIIIPGEIRNIMNTVLIAEKRAQANVITRREEVASTRSLLNTAKMMEESPILYKLKELEYIQNICDHVDSINLSSSGDLISQLVGLLGKPNN